MHAGILAAQPLESVFTEALAKSAGFFGACLILFLLLREVWCWYWKINAALTELRAIRAELEEINARSRTAAHTPRAEPSGDAWEPTKFR
ncbi:MAG: hypothetical protein AAB721_02895 [Patescibacteria group bacterium]